MPSGVKGNHDAFWRIVLWSTVLLGVGVAYFDANPILVDAEEELAPGSVLALDAVSDVLLIVDYGSMISNPERFEDVDFSLAWLNTLQQEVGPVAIADAEKVAQLDLSAYRLVVVTRSAASQDAWLPKLKGYVDRGGTLVLEMPQGSVRESFSADGLGERRSPQQITYMAGLLEDLQLALQQISPPTEIVGSSGPLDGAETLMTIDGVPVIYRKQLGAGWVISVDFDYGRLLTALQQGMPHEGFRVRSVRGDDQVESIDLAYADALIESSVPLADVLERFLIYGVIDGSSPIIGFWPFFDGMDGALVMTHDERSMGDASIWMAAHEKPFKASSTYFVRVPASMTEDGLGALTNLGIDIGMEWNRGSESDGAYEGFGLFGVEPVQRAMSLSEQLAGLDGTAANLPSVISVRHRDFLWSRQWEEPFAAMTAAGFRADSSYAAPRGRLAYAFGTGLPFMPLSREGLAFPMLEFPVSLVANGSLTERDELSRALSDSQVRDHQLLSVAFSPAEFADAPSVQWYLNWRDSYRMAAEKNHWITSVRNFYRFSRGRHNSEIRANRSETVLSGRSVTLLRVETLALESGMSLCVPRRIGTRTFSEARRGLQRVQGDKTPADKLISRDIMVMGYERVLLPLTKGFNSIDIIFE
ncbi:MAG: hypothetical protein RBU37_25390 [Myxococcota bacterium]|nr:hypothetical protein [Myxococcota bacterium]